MGLTYKSTGNTVLTDNLSISKNSSKDKVIALAGNPNVGKSTVFNELTGLHQHTGNWPGKTVANAQGTCIHKGINFTLVDIPGTYSLMASSVEEEIARNFICFGNPDATIVVTDATSLERNLNLVLQTLEITNNVVVCVNLLDEAEKKGITIDLTQLSFMLDVPVIGTSAREGKGLDVLMDNVYDVAFNFKTSHKKNIVYSNNIEFAISLLEPIVNKLVDNKINSRWVSIKLLNIDENLGNELNNFLGFNILENPKIIDCLGKINLFFDENNMSIEDVQDEIIGSILNRAEKIYKATVHTNNTNYDKRTKRLDKLLTSKSTGIPIMILLLAGILWLSIVGANYPSDLIYNFLFFIESKLIDLFNYINAPLWLSDVLISGIYKTVAWVVSVMLPPMAIFFPLFTLLEDSGYLPRIAFNLDHFFKKAHAHGKQALTTCMGFGCNACGVIGCRIIDSPRERLIAILTNNFVPCNGRFPTLIAIITMFFAGFLFEPVRSIVSTVLLTGIIILGIITTLFISKLLSKTILKGMPSSFILELPPYRRPQINKVLIRSIFDRTLFVLNRAIIVAAPTGLLIWLMANVTINDISLLTYCTSFLDPFANLIGLDGVILMAFILGFPANEIVIPIIIMSYLATGSLTDFSNLEELYTLLINNGWTITTAICTMLFCLFHFPCSTTCLTIKKETGSLKWSLIAFILPTMVGIIMCFLVNLISNIFFV